MEDLLHVFWDFTFGRRYKLGPLVIDAYSRDHHVELTLENQGKRKINIAAIQAHDDRNLRHFPETDLPPSPRFPPARHEPSLCLPRISDP